MPFLFDLIKKKKSSSLSSYQLVLYILLFLVLLKKILILWMPSGILSIKNFNNNTFLKVWTYDFLHVAMVCTTKGSYCRGNLCWSLLFTCISLCRSLNRESKREKKTTIIWWIMKLQGQTYSFIHFRKMSDWNIKVFWYSSKSKVIFHQLVLAYSPSCNSTNPPEMNHFKLFSSIEATT